MDVHTRICGNSYLLQGVVVRVKKANLHKASEGMSSTEQARPVPVSYHHSVGVLTHVVWRKSRPLSVWACFPICTGRRLGFSGL